MFRTEENKFSHPVIFPIEILNIKAQRNWNVFMQARAYIRTLIINFVQYK
jgi:hypothetical protein